MYTTSHKQSTSAVNVYNITQINIPHPVTHNIIIYTFTHTHACMHAHTHTHTHTLLLNYLELDKKSDNKSNCLDKHGL